MTKYYCGLDLASVSYNPSGIVILSKNKSKKPKVELINLVKTDKEIIETNNRFNLLFCAINAPFKLGLESFRSSEEKLISLGYELMSPAMLIGLINRNKTIQKKLKSNNIIEVHSNTSAKALNLGENSEEKLIKLKKEIDGIEDRDYNDHEINSLIASYTAFLFDNEQAISYGKEGEEIIVPHVKEFKLAVFDLDGTITKPYSSWEYVHGKLGTWDVGKVNLEKFLKGKISYIKFAKADAKPWKGTSIEQMQEIINSVEYVKDIEKLIEGLKKKGIEIAIISGGLQMLADRVAKKFDIKYSYANILKDDGKVLNGGIKVKVDYNGKNKVYKKLLKKLKVKPYQVITFGDSPGDIILFKNSGFSVAINPLDKKVSEAANFNSYSVTEVIMRLGL